MGFSPAQGNGSDLEPTRPEPVSIAGTSGKFIDEFDDDGNVTLFGNAVVRDGNLTLAVPVLFEDDFSTPGGGKWTLAEGSGTIEGGLLQMASTTKMNTTMSHPIDHRNVRLTATINFTTFGQGGVYMDLAFPDSLLRLTYDCVEREIRWEVNESGRRIIIDNDLYTKLDEATEYKFTLTSKDEMSFVFLRYKHWTEHFRCTENLTAIRLGCWGGAEGTFDDLLVEDLEAKGVALSRAVDLPRECLWDEAYSTNLWCYAEEVGNVDIVDAATGEVIPPFKDINSHQARDIQEIHVYDHPSIRLRARIWLEGVDEPRIRNWSLSWKEGGLLWMDSFDDISRCTVDGAELLWTCTEYYDWKPRPKGAVGVNTTVWTDEFTTFQGSSWSTVSTAGEGDVRVEDGYLWIEGPDTAGEWSGVEWEFDVPGLFLNFDFFVDFNGPGGFELNISTESGKAFILTRDEGTELVWLVWDGHEHRVIYDIGRFWMGAWYDDGEIGIRQDGSMDFGGGAVYSGGYHYFGEDFTRLQLKCGQGFDLHVDRMMLQQHRLSGSVVSETVVLPAGMMWTRARLVADLDTARLDVLDASTLQPVPGYGGLSSSEMTFEGWAYALDIRGIDPEHHPALRLRYHVHAFEVRSPALYFWQLWWKPGSSVLMDPFDDGTGVEWTEDMAVVDGRLTTPNVLLEDDFTRFDISPWTVEEGVADTLMGALWTQSREAEETSVALDLSEHGPDGVSVRSYVHRMEEWGPGIELRGADGRSYSLVYDNGRSLLEIIYNNLVLSRTIWSQPYEWEGNEWINIDIRYRRNAIELSIGLDAFTIPILNYFAVDDLVLHSGDALLVYWDDLVVSRDRMAGSAITHHITLPEGEGWLWLEVEHGALGNSSLSMSLVDAGSGVAVPGFESMEATLYDISGIDIGEHPMVQLRFDMAGEFRDMPYVDWYRIYWTGLVDAIFQIKEFEDIEVMEDTPVTDILNVMDHFTSTLTDPMDLLYEVTDVSDPSHVLPRLAGWMLAIDLPSEDWFGSASFRFTVSTGEVNLTTAPITVVVLPVDDPPVFQSVGTLEVTEDEPEEVDLLGWLFIDVDTAARDLMLKVPDGNATVDGTTLELLFTTGGFEVVVPVSVSDLTTTVEGTLRVHVVTVDDGPVISHIGIVDMVEDVRFTFDITSYVFDEDTDVEDLSVSIDEPNCSVDGLLLTFYYGDVPEGGLDLRLSLTVSDGTSSVNATLHVRVADVPEPTFGPKVKEVATQRFTVGVERTVNFGPFVTDADTPLEDLTIMCDHPAVVSNQGLRVTFRFSEATEDTVAIAFTVSDGTNTVPASFLAVISEKEEDPGLPRWWTGSAGLLLLFIIAIVLVLVAVVVYLRTRTD